MLSAYGNDTAGNGTREGHTPESEIQTGALLGVTLLLVLVPAIIIATIYVCYTLNQVYLAVTIIEEEHDPYSEDFWNGNAGRFSDNPLDDIESDLAYGLVDASYLSAEPNIDIFGPSPPTTSLRLIADRLRHSSGRLASFRGLFVFSMILSFGALAKVAYFLATLTRTTESENTWTVSPFLVSDLSTGFPALVVSLAAVQMSTHWVHTIITARKPLSPSHLIPHLGSLRSLKFLCMGWWTILYLLLGAVRMFRKSLPPFKETFHATAMPVALHWLALNAARWIDGQARSALGVSRIGLVVEPRRAWSAAMALVINYVAYLILVVPAKAVLFRIQASLLPREVEPIVPFWHAIERLVEPRRVGGTGYLSMNDAWRSISRQSWRRLIIVYAKISCINAMFYFMLPAAVHIVFLVVSHYIKHTTKRAEDY